MQRPLRHPMTLIITLIMMLMSLPTSAQGTAEVWLNKATEKLHNKGSEITFRVNEEGMRFGGKLLIDGPCFAYDSEEMKIWYDGTTQWTLQMGSGYNELYISNPTPEEQKTINPYLLLCDYEKTFDVTDLGERTCNGKLTHVVGLDSRDANYEPSHVDVCIQSDGTLAALIISTANENTIKIEVRSMRNGLTFPKSTFTYQAEKYPADEVIDMR